MKPKHYTQAAQRLNKTERYLLSLLLAQGELALATLQQHKQYKSLARASTTLFKKGLLDKHTKTGYKNNAPYRVVLLKLNLYSYCVQIPSIESRCKNAEATA